MTERCSTAHDETTAAINVVAAARAEITNRLRPTPETRAAVRKLNAALDDLRAYRFRLAD